MEGMSFKTYIYCCSVLVAARQDMRCPHHAAYKEHVGGMCHPLHESTVLAARLLSFKQGRERQNEETFMELVLFGRHAKIEPVLKMFF